jgi:hypothetical protein
LWGCGVVEVVEVVEAAVSVPRRAQDPGLPMIVVGSMSVVSPKKWADYGQR